MKYAAAGLDAAVYRKPPARQHRRRWTVNRKRG